MRHHVQKFNCLLWVCLVCAVWPAAAWAGDDGGGRSVFAFGAGNRALGLGGAYAGVANDASSPLWNPGGLGLVPRPEFQGSQTSYYGLDINEQFASLVIPSWRWGTASVTLRHFGVGGIERRDDRNVLLEEDLSDSETEFAVGYGRRLGKAWSLGGVVKFQRQSLAGFTGSGVGVDIGAAAQPLLAIYPHSTIARRLSVGAAVRNAVEPNIRLSTEHVPDPTGLRFGTAYLIPVFGNRSILLAVDFEKTRDMDTRVHGGVEFTFHPLLQLRAGVNDGTFTAGSGVTWRGVTLDYVFENTSLGGVHRVGAVFSFGETVEQRRYAAMEERENELQASLAEAFDKRQAERIKELLMQADSAMRRGHFDDALAPLAVVAALEPGNTGALSRQSLCFTEIGGRLEEKGDYAAAVVSYSRALSIAPDDPDASSGYERCRAESDRQAARSQKIRRQFEIALDAFGENKLVDAKRGFEEILQTAPEDEEAASMLRRTQDAIDHRVADLLAETNRMIEWGQLDEARSRLDDARHLAPDAREIRTAEASLSDAFAKRVKRASEDARGSGATGQTGVDGPGNEELPSGQKTTRSVTDAERREVERLYKSGVDAMSEGRSRDAIRYFELVWSVDPLYQRVSDHLKREYLMRGMEFFADGRLDKAVEYWENARRVDPTDQRVIGYLSRAREQVARTRQILGNDQ